MFLNYRTFPRSAVRWAARLAALCLAAALPVAGARAENIIFPEDAGVIDVTKAPYNAKGDGAADDTEAIQKAFLDYAGKDAVIYLPNGTYRITDTISWAGKATRNILQGQSTDGTVLRLADRCGGFTDPTQPKPMVFTGKLPPQRFRNAIRNLTIDTGKGNPGAIGARFNASNQGQMANVTIRSGDGSGPIGLDMGYTSDVGPLFIKNLRVVGFDVGIYTAYGVAGQALEHISLQGQNVCGFINDGQAVSIRGFTSVNAVPAFFNKRVSGMAVILDASLTGEGAASRAAAIINDAALYARHVKTAGYRTAIDGSHGTGAGAPGPEVEEFVSHPVLSLFPSPMHSLNLPVTDTPEVPWDNLADWVSAAKFPPKEATIMKEHKEKDGTVKQVPTKVMDYTDSIQKAIDSGAKTVYFPTPKAGKPVYEVLGTVHVRGKVRRIIGMESAFGTQGTGVFQLDDGEAPVVVLERFDWIYSPIIVRTASKRTLVVSAIPGANYDVGPGGRVFLEDIVAMFRMAPGSHVWIRQFNTEYTQQWHANTLIDPRPLAEPPGSVNNGGTLWILGIKTEGDGTIITTTGGGQTEVLGGVIYANKDRDPKKKIFVNTESSLSVSLGEFVSRNQPFNPIVETRDGVTRTMPPGVTPGRAAGSLLALYTGYRAPAGQPTTVPIDLAAKHAAAPPPPAGSGNGLRGDYFAGAAFANLKATRTDPAIDFDWKDKPPAEGLAPDRYSVR
ncbi:MAG: glycosyl hydrolase family 28-related protein, partial [Planctomycetota bacterium]|nr:glycosyl hydrolase family 28-related protein [Planctomycetota bacterium]